MVYVGVFGVFCGYNIGGGGGGGVSLCWYDGVVVCVEKKLLKLLFCYQVGFTQVFRDFSVSSRCFLLELLLDIVIFWSY